MRVNIVSHHLIFFVFLYFASNCLSLHFRVMKVATANNQSLELNKNEINKYILSLSYNRDEVLAYKEKSVMSVKAEGHLDNKRNFIAIFRERKSMWNGKADIGVLTSNEHITYPGSLLLLNSRLIENSPDYVSIARAPIKYTVNLPGITSDGSFSIVPSFGNYQAAVNGVLKTWFKKYSHNHSVNTIFQSDYSFAYNKAQLRVKFGEAFRYNVVEANIDFNAIDKQEKLVLIQRFQQIFYTVSVEAPEKPSDLFGNNVTRAQVARKFNNENPPVMVDSVSYGRVIYVKIETTSTDKNAKILLESKLATINDINGSTDLSRKLRNFNMQVYVMGGGSDHIALVNAKDFKDVKEVIVKYGKFSSMNVGYPISYSMEFIKDNSRAIIKSSAEYTETTRSEHRKGTIILKHSGWYVARWGLYWDEVNYDKHGNKIVTYKGWRKNGDDILAPFTAEIELGGNCENISVFAEEATGLIWEKWRTIIDRSGIPLIKERQFTIWGTTLNPKYSVEPDE